MITEKQARQEYRQHRKEDSVFADCWPDTDKHFYEWCSSYLDYEHIKEKDE
jgi:hypothetical protein